MGERHAEDGRQVSREPTRGGESRQDVAEAEKTGQKMGEIDRERQDTAENDRR
jgi:hypothetical protein